MPLKMVIQGHRIFTPRQTGTAMHGCEDADVQDLRGDRDSVSAAVTFSHAICWFPGIRMHPTPFTKVSWIGKTLQWPSRTAMPKGLKMELHQDREGTNCLADMTA